MIITKKHLPRRAVLRGMGACLALPLLDGMIPAFSGVGHAATKPVKRFLAIYAGNGMVMDNWIPATEGRLELSPILQPLTPFADRSVIISGLNSFPVNLVQDGAIHPRAQTAWLTGALAKKTNYDVAAGTSLDQLAAREIGTDTVLRSLELAMESAEGLSGNCAYGYSCAYNNTVSWKDEKTPLPMEANPRALFERLFGVSDSTDSKVRLSLMRKNRSVLDSVIDKVARLQPTIAPDDRIRLDRYLDAVRDVERRIQRAETQADRELPIVAQPAGIPASFEEHAKLQFDLLALALQTDMTRVATFLLARELSNRAYPEIGVPESHHPLSHHGQNPDKMARLTKLNIFHLSLYAHLVKTLAETEDGDGTLLDRTITFYGAGISNSNVHDPMNLPALIVGGQALGVKGGRHMRVEKDTPVSNLYTTFLHKLGVNAERFGDATGALPVDVL